MENQFELKTTTGQILMVLKVLAWVAFIGYAIEAGAIILSFLVSLANSEAARNLYKGLDLYDLSQLDFLQYAGSVSFLVALAIMKSSVWYLVIKTLTRINLENPFKMKVARLLEQISYSLLGIWIVGMISSGYAAWLEKTTGQAFGTEVSGEFIFVAGVVFVISQVFKRGVEIQTENELTV